MPDKSGEGLQRTLVCKANRIEAQRFACQQGRMSIERASLEDEVNKRLPQQDKSHGRRYDDCR